MSKQAEEILKQLGRLDLDDLEYLREEIDMLIDARSHDDLTGEEG